MIIAVGPATDGSSDAPIPMVNVILMPEDLENMKGGEQIQIPMHAPNPIGFGLKEKGIFALRIMNNMEYAQWRADMEATGCDLKDLPGQKGELHP